MMVVTPCFDPRLPADLREHLLWAVSNPPTQAEVQAIADKLDELINTSGG